MESKMTKFNIELNNTCAVINGVKTWEDFTEVTTVLSEKFGKREILYIFTTPDGQAIVIIFK